MKALPKSWRGELDGSLLLGFALLLTRALSPALRLARIDRTTFDLLLRARLVLDLKGDARSPRSSGANLGAVIAILAAFAMGLFSGISAFFGTGPVFFLAIVQSVLGGIIALTILVQFAGLFVDPTDVEVLAARPVRGREVFAARLVHIYTYLAVLGSVFSFGPAVFGALGLQAWQPLVVVPLASLFTALIVLAAIALLFSLTLMVVGPARFQRVALYVQIGTVVLLMGGGQVVLNSVSVFAPAIGEIDREQVLAVVRSFPPVQQGELLAWSLGAEGAHAGSALAAVLVPFASVLLVFALASKHYVAATTGAYGGAARETRRWPTGLGAFVARRFTLTPEERAGFGQGWAMTARDPMYVRSTWVSLAALVGPLLGLGATLGRREGDVLEIALLLLPYLMVLAGLTVTQQARVTSNADARWIYHAVPGAPSREHLSGVLLATIVRFVLPLALLFAVTQVLVLGVRAVPDALLAGFAMVIGSVWFGSRAHHHVPFSWTPQAGDVDLRNLPLVFASLGSAAAGALVHGLLWYFTPSWLRLLLALGLLPVLRRAPGWLRQRDPEPLPE